MFTLTTCSEPGCTLQALTGSKTCAKHHRDANAYVDEMLGTIMAGGTIKNLCMPGVVLENRVLSGKKFICCSFTGARLSGLDLTGSVFRLCFFDGATIETCDFSAVNAEFCSFGDTEIRDTRFEKTELVHVNFDGARIRDSTFAGSNLYNSRFIYSVLENSDLSDCDFRKVYYMPARQENVSLRATNTNEAIRDMEHLYL